MSRRVTTILAILAGGVAAVAAAAPSAGAARAPRGSVAVRSAPPSLVRSLQGRWEIYSASLFWDAGGGTTAPASPAYLIVTGLHWRWGGEAGTVAVKPITAIDWRVWGVHPYGPTYKVVWTNSHRFRTDGPIEETRGRAVFLWSIYREGPPTIQAPARVDLKFGHVNP